MSGSRSRAETRETKKEADVQKDIHSVGVCIPILNPGVEWGTWLDALEKQTLKPSVTLVIDSSSTDGSAEIARIRGLEVIPIPRAAFNHGGTRQIGVDRLTAADIVVFCTQDAILASESALAKLVAVFGDSEVGAAFGRQLPRETAGPIEAHARLFNYPDTSRIVSMSDVPRLGIKAAFISNSFAAYRRDTLLAVGGFPKDLVMGEDTVVAARMLLAGFKIAYQADAQAYHSHAYTPAQEFRRYFDTGVLHAREHWFGEKLGRADNEGGRFVRSELRYLANIAPGLVPSALWRTLLKYLGYRLGRTEASLPVSVKKRMSMHKGFWNG